LHGREEPGGRGVFLFGEGESITLVFIYYFVGEIFPFDMLGKARLAFIIA